VDDTLQLALTKPVKLGDVEYTEITLTEPTAGQIETALREPQQTTANIVLIAAIAKVPPGAVRNMCLRDFNKCVQFLEGFTKGEEE
jgi:hypothetical protein